MKARTQDAPIPLVASIWILWNGSFKLMGLFNTEVFRQKRGWKGSNITGIVVDFTGRLLSTRDCYREQLRPLAGGEIVVIASTPPVLKKRKKSKPGAVG